MRSGYWTTLKGTPAFTSCLMIAGRFGLRGFFDCGSDLESLDPAALSARRGRLFILPIRRTSRISAFRAIITIDQISRSARCQGCEQWGGIAFANRSENHPKSMKPDFLLSTRSKFTSHLEARFGTAKISALQEREARARPPARRCPTLLTLLGSGSLRALPANS